MASRTEVELLSIAELAQFLEEQLRDRVPQTSNIAASFQANNISGKIFLELTPEELKDLVPLIGDRKEFQRLLDRYLAPVVVS